LDRLHVGGAATHAAFAQWLHASPLHIQAFLEISTLERVLDKVGPTLDLDIDDLLAGATPNVATLELLASPALSPEGDGATEFQGVSHSASLRERTHVPGSSLKLFKYAAAAAIALLAVLVWRSVPALRGERTYATDVGEEKHVVLADGSAIDLSASSRVRVLLTNNARDVVLDGEAMFSVHHDAARPFRVHSGNAIVQAVGTQFDVDLRPSGTVVSVLEGVVQISAPAGNAPQISAPAQLHAGEEARVRKNGSIERQPAAKTIATVVAHRPRLMFEDERLEDIVAEFNRWNRLQIHVDGSALAGRLYSGAFDAEDPSSLIAFLRQDATLNLQASEDHIRISERE
jgi:transmembrane sensor